MSTSSAIRELEIILDESLEATEIKPKELVPLLTKNKENFTLVRNVIENSVTHMNYLEYLQRGWANHRGVIISPDFVWHIILNEFAVFIKDNSDLFRSLFTTSDDKVAITVYTKDMELIDLELIANALRKLVPTDIDLFVPTFSTSTKTSNLALIATFADAMSPYYDYWMLCCGIPKIKVQGEIEDWLKVNENLRKLDDLLVHPVINKYIKSVTKLVENIIININEPEISFWKDIFTLARCGSGGQFEVKGWIANLFIKTPDPAYVHNYPTCVSYVGYKNLTNNTNYELVYGLFSSKEENDYLIPEFGYLILEENK